LYHLIRLINQIRLLCSFAIFPFNETFKLYIPYCYNWYHNAFYSRIVWFPCFQDILLVVSMKTNRLFNEVWTNGNYLGWFLPVVTIWGETIRKPWFADCFNAFPSFFKTNWCASLNFKKLWIKLDSFITISSKKLLLFLNPQLNPRLNTGLAVLNFNPIPRLTGLNIFLVHKFFSAYGEFKFKLVELPFRRLPSQIRSWKCFL